MKKLASVLPTRMVQRKRSGLSKKRFNILAEFLPERARRRIRNRFKAKTPASIPERRKETSRQIRKVNAFKRFKSIYFWR